MSDMSEARNRKATELRHLAAQFRAKAAETQLATYVDLMRRSASELERLAAQLDAEADTVEARSRCA